MWYHAEEFSYNECYFRASQLWAAIAELGLKFHLWINLRQSNVCKLLKWNTNWYWFSIFVLRWSPLLIEKVDHRLNISAVEENVSNSSGYWRQALLYARAHIEKHLVSWDVIYILLAFSKLNFNLSLYKQLLKLKLNVSWADSNSNFLYSRLQSHLFSLVM